MDHTENPRTPAGASEAPRAPSDAPESDPQRPDASQDPGAPAAAAGGREAAYTAAFAFIHGLSSEGAWMNAVARNALIWRAVHVALDAAGVGTCVASHCVENDHTTTGPADPKESA